MHSRSLRSMLFVSLILFGTVASIAISAQVIVSPGPQTGSEGGANNGAPFNIFNDIPHGLMSSEHYQQVYNALDFSSITTPALITKIAFRPDATFGAAFSSTFPNVQIDLSTPINSADGLSRIFPDNVGSNDTVVHTGSLFLSSAFAGPAGGPKNFDIVINLTTPFLYTPGTNILLDVRNFVGVLTTQFDAQNVNGDSVSRLHTPGNVNEDFGNLDTTGLVTQFTFTPGASSVPEPGSLALLAGLGVTGSLFALKRLRQRSR